MTNQEAIHALAAMKAREESGSKAHGTVGQQLSAQSAARNAKALGAAIDALARA